MHGKENLPLVEKDTERLRSCDLLLLAGDVTDKNDIESYGLVVSKLRELSDAELVAVFGNEEYDELHDEYRKRFPITFLEEEKKDLEVDDVKVRVVGSTGSLDRPTWWQRTHLPGAWERYRERIGEISGLLVKDDADVLALLTHYAPTYATLVGEREGAYQEMGSLALEKVIIEKRPDLVLHAHAHRGRTSAKLTRRQRSLEDYSATSSEVTVSNVSLPARGGVTFFEVGREKNGIGIRELW
ncbi:MAG: metallophosphoesterase [Methanomassiliicoccales archaeon]|nr:metallophosphoesterase [Methanomassiliicoccales archaeon]